MTSSYSHSTRGRLPTGGCIDLDTIPIRKCAQELPTVCPDTGCTISGASSASGTRTKARSCRRGCGRVSSGVEDHVVDQQQIEIERARSVRKERVRPRSRSMPSNAWRRSMEPARSSAQRPHSGTRLLQVSDRLRLVETRDFSDAPQVSSRWTCRPQRRHPIAEVRSQPDVGRCHRGQGRGAPGQLSASRGAHAPPRPSCAPPAPLPARRGRGRYRRHPRSPGSPSPPFPPAGHPPHTQHPPDHALARGARQDRSPQCLQLPNRRSSSRFCRQSLPNPNPGSTISLSP